MHPFYYSNRMLPIVVSAFGDVTGDNIIDGVYLTGIQTPSSPFIQKISLVVRNGQTGKVTTISLKENAGYNPTLFLGDFTGEGTKDILIGINSGGSGGIMYYYMYSFADDIPRLQFDFEIYNDEFSYLVNYLDNYQVEVVSVLNASRYILDITYKGSQYLSEIYDSSGKLRYPISGFVNPLSGLYPVDFDADGVYELLAFQKIAGRYNADALGFVQNILTWKVNRFQLDRQFIAIFGSN